MATSGSGKTRAKAMPKTSRKTGRRTQPPRAPLDRFIATHELAKHLETARRLVLSELEPTSDVAVALEQDPETAEQWVELTFQVDGEPADVLERYNAYTRRWVTSAPPRAVDRIRITYEVV
jgi:hypothetical protein